MFEELCGADALQNVILITTMWNQVKGDVGSRREDQLRTEFWQPMMSRGCRMARFSLTHESAWEVIDKFDISARRPVKIQKEMVDEGKELAQTSAYFVLFRWWENLIAKLREMLRLRDLRPEGSSGNDSGTALDKQLELALKQKQMFDEKHSNHSSEVVTMARVLRRGSKHGSKARKRP